MAVDTEAKGVELERAVCAVSRKRCLAGSMASAGYARGQYSRCPVTLVRSSSNCITFLQIDRDKPARHFTTPRLDSPLKCPKVAKFERFGLSGV